MSQDRSPLVVITDLVLTAATRRGTAHILRGVSLEIGRGRIVGVVGESGSGKSSLALAILRLLPGNVTGVSGRIVMDGQDILSLPEATLAQEWRGSRLAMIFQDPATALNPLFTIGTQLIDVLRHREPGLSRRDARSRVEGALARVEIADPHRRLRAYPHELSGGMRQRVMIAMALLVRPDLLLADEPTTALDATVEAGIVALLQDLRTELGGSVLFISHHMGLVAGLCDDVAVMYAGQIVEAGPADAVCLHPKHPYTAALLACEPDSAPPGPLPTIPGEVPDPVVTPLGCLFAARCAYAEPACERPQPLRSLAPNWRAACWKAT
jgi:oligopeptide/dipeptide ABC transporter ATP-binding protein